MANAKVVWKAYYVFWSFLLYQVLISNQKIVPSLFKAYILYLFLGGWKFQRIVFHTLLRDLNGLRALLMIRIWIYWLVNRGETIAKSFSRVVRQRGRQTVALWFEDDQWTFGQLDAYSNQVGRCLLEAGLKPGDTLLLLLHSCPAYIGIMLGAAKVGIATSLVNTNLKKNSLAHCLAAVNSTSCIVGLELRDAFREASTDRQHNWTHLWYLDETKSRSCDLELSSPASMTLENVDDESGKSWNSQLAQTSSSKLPDESLCRSKPRDPLFYIYTSGTTGLPKAAIISTFRYYYMTTGIHYAFNLSPERDILYTPLPLYHTAGAICGVGHLLLYGVPIVLRKKFSASSFWSDCVKYQCTVVQYIGEICRFLLAQPPRPTDQQHQVRLAYGNGLQSHLWPDFQSRFNVTQIGEFYGATESNTCLINNDNKTGAIGFLTQLVPAAYPVRLIRMDVALNEPWRDPQTGFCQLAEPHETGQLVGKIASTDPVRAFDGYSNNRKETSKKILHNVFTKGDAWFASGDLVSRDEFGYVYFVDRLGDTFRWKGENVSTSEVEAAVANALPSNTSSTTFTVYGVPVPHCEGKAGMIALATNDRSRQADSLKEVEEEDRQRLVAKLYQALTDELPTYARPLFIRFCRDMTMTGTFKLCKNDLALAGFNLDKVNGDLLYLIDPPNKTYQPLDSTLYTRLLEGAVRI